MSQQLLNKKYKSQLINIYWSSPLSYRTDKNRLIYMYSNHYYQGLHFWCLSVQHSLHFWLFFLHPPSFPSWTVIATLQRCLSYQAKSDAEHKKSRSELWKSKVKIEFVGTKTAQLTLLSVSLYCCTKSSLMSTVYTSELCHSDSSKRYSLFLLAFFRTKLIMDSVVSCTAVLASCHDTREDIQ